MRDIEGLSHEEVAERMDRKVGAVRMLWVRALACLKKDRMPVADSARLYLNGSLCRLPLQRERR